MSHFKLLNSDEICLLLGDLPDWKLENKNLVATFIFSSFSKVIAFINIVASESEANNHHSSFTSTYKKIEFRLCTHDAGDRITDLDIKLAKYISKAALQFI